MEIKDKTYDACAFDVWFTYMNGVTNSSVAITATAQKFTVFSDDAVI